VLRMMFGPKRGGGSGDCRELSNEELYDLCTSPNIIRVINQMKVDEMDGACGTNGREKKYV
jgi:hypothetical protein